MRSQKPVADPQIPPMRGVRLLRALQKVLPLGRRYHPLVSILNPSHGLFSIPFEGCSLVHPASWRKYATAFLLAGRAVVPEFVLLEKLLAQLPGGHLVDVGANIGIYTLLMRKASSRPIISYEPQPFLFDLLKANARHNNLENVDLRNLACGAASGTIPFHIGINGAVATGADTASGDRREPGSNDNRDAWRSTSLDDAAGITQAGKTVVHVPLTTLDENLAGTKVALLKIDCEGFETSILAGAQAILRRDRPFVFVEAHPVDLEKYGSSLAALIAILQPMYTLEGWDFSLDRHRSKLVRSWRKHRFPRGREFQGMDEMLNVAARAPRPTQLYLVCRPTKVA